MSNNSLNIFSPASPRRLPRNQAGSRSSSRSSRSRNAKGGNEAFVSKERALGVDAIKEEFMSKLKQREEKQYKTLNDIAKKSPTKNGQTAKVPKDGDIAKEAGHGTVMLPENILQLEKMDLLVYVQKIQLMLDQERERRQRAESKLAKASTVNDRGDANNQESLYKKLKDDNAKLKGENSQITLQLKSAEKLSEAQLRKIKSAYTEIEAMKRKLNKMIDDSDKAEDVQIKLEKVNSELNIQTEKRKRMEMLFQDVSEREMKIQQLLDDSEERAQLLEEENLGLRMNCEEEKTNNGILKEKNDQLQLELGEVQGNTNKSQTYVQTDPIGQSEDCTDTQDELLKLVHESDAALESKVKELDSLREKLTKTDEANHKLIVESQVLKREILDIKESTTKDKHVSISATERHKREREQLLKEIDAQNREMKKMREDQKKKDLLRESETEKLAKNIANLTEKLKVSESATEELKIKLKTLSKEEHYENNIPEGGSDETEALVKSFQVTVNKLTLELEALNKKNAHLKLENKKIANTSTKLQQGRCHRGTSTNPYLVDEKEENRSIQLTKEDPTTAMDDVAKELSSVKNELNLLKGILEEKDKELTKAKSISSLILRQHSSDKESQNPELQKTADDLKFQLYAKENQLLEVDLKLQFAERKVNTYDAHVSHLRERVENLETQLEATAKVHFRI